MDSLESTSPASDEVRKDTTGRTPMSKAQHDAIGTAPRTEPVDLNQGVAEHRRTFDAMFAVQPYPADVTAREATLGGVAALELTVTGNAEQPNVLYFHGGGYVVGSARTGARLAAELARRAGGRAWSVGYRLA